MTTINGDTHLAHYGILRKSGRYPWGSGGSQSARNRSFLDITEAQRREGLSDTEIARGHGITTTELRAARSIAGNQQKLEKIATANQLKAKGMSNIAIGEQMGVNESSVRSLLAPGLKDRADVLKTTSDMLKRQVADKTYVDVGVGVENRLKITNTKLKTAVAMLKEEGYEVHSVQVDQLGAPGKKTTVKVLAPPGTTYRDVAANKHNIRQIDEFSDDGGRSMLNVLPHLNVDSKRILVKWDEDKGGLEDGVIHIRPGVPDVSIGNARYAQVRVGVDGTHFLKGMARYDDNVPKGYDLVVHTPKKNTGNKLDAMKPLKDEPDNPFGSTIRQIPKYDEHGRAIPNTVGSAMNIVGGKEGAGEEGSWDTWSRNLSTQLLSKQSPTLAKQQLDITFDRKKNELEEIKSLTNPTVRRKLLEAYADGADSSAVHLKAAALPRQATQVLLPVRTLKPTEIYAPNFRNGETVALVRYPHGGTFEIPELTVNNRHKEAQRILGKDAKDAVGINPEVAKRLSGADFDGDTVVVIPNSHGHIKSTPALKDLKNFDPQRDYKLPPNAPKMSARTKGMQMGLVSNLITDMTIKGAPPEEIARAVKHSMVVIDAEKHHLDYKRSAIDNGIRQLNLKYQDRAQGGASTLISRATSDKRVPDRRERSPKEGGPIDPRTGKKVFEAQPRSFTTKDGRTIVKQRRSTKLGETDDAFSLISKEKTPIEVVYAEHSNRMKQLANDARIEVAAFKPPRMSKSAKDTYKSEVASLNAKLSLARQNKPLERQAQIFANARVAQLKAANPTMDAADLKKASAQALAAARARVGAEKFSIRPTEKEWEAIQAGAISQNQLKQMLDNADLDHIKKLATPPRKKLMSPTKTATAARMALRGYTQAEIADHLGVSLTTLKEALA